VVGVADALDPWFVRFKEVIGAFHWTPQEALALRAPTAQARSVICWCLPVAEAVRIGNRAETLFPSRAWAFTRTQGDKVLGLMQQGLADHLEAQGHASLAPDSIQENAVERPGVGLAANWSLRHVAFVAGLGTFGISGGLITQRGIAHRIGAVITEAAVPPTPRQYGDDPFAWCLRTSRGICGKCIERCPVGSVGQGVADRDKTACLEHGRRIRREGKSLYGWEGRYGCGLCQTAVPCEFGLPTANRSS
jgi:epoxyqueuosine reductase